VVAAALIAGVAGCGGRQPELTVASITNHRIYHQPFTQAYASRRNGDLEVVLADNAAVAALAGQVSGAPVRQIMHVHVFWLPTHGMGASPVTNATLHWYVLGDSTRPGDILEYAGTAFVTIDEDPVSPTISIQNATLKCAYQHGLADPVGASRLNGTVTADIDESRVAQLLHEVETAALPPTAATTAPAAAAAQ
jgi:hypothetical protein